MFLASSVEKDLPPFGKTSPSLLGYCLFVYGAYSQVNMLVLKMSYSYSWKCVAVSSAKSH